MFFCGVNNLYIRSDTKLALRSVLNKTRLSIELIRIFYFNFEIRSVLNFNSDRYSILTPIGGKLKCYTDGLVTPIGVSVSIRKDENQLSDRIRLRSCDIFVYMMIVWQNWQI